MSDAPVLRWLLFFGLALASAGAAEAPARQRVSLDAGWAFHLGDAAGADQPGFDAGTWRRLDLPHDWSIEAPVDPAAPGGGQDGFFLMGVGWYRRTIFLPSSQITLIAESPGLPKSALSLEAAAPP